MLTCGDLNGAVCPLRDARCPLSRVNNEVSFRGVSGVIYTSPAVVFVPGDSSPACLPMQMAVRLAEHLKGFGLPGMDGHIMTAQDYIAWAAEVKP